MVDDEPCRRLRRISIPAQVPSAVPQILNTDATKHSDDDGRTPRAVSHPDNVGPNTRLKTNAIASDRTAPRLHTAKARVVLV